MKLLVLTGNALLLVAWILTIRSRNRALREARYHRVSHARHHQVPLMEVGRRLASLREDMIAAGVDPAHLPPPLAPLPHWRKSHD